MNVEPILPADDVRIRLRCVSGAVRASYVVAGSIGMFSFLVVLALTAGVRWDVDSALGLILLLDGAAASMFLLLLVVLTRKVRTGRCVEFGTTALRTPVAWCLNRTRAIRYEDVEGLVMTSRLGMRRLLVFQSSMWVSGLPAWWFSSLDDYARARDELVSRVESCRDDAGNRRAVASRAILARWYAGWLPASILGAVLIVAFLAHTRGRSELGVLEGVIAGARASWLVFDGEPFRLFSYGFVHWSVAHLVTNVVGILLLSRWICPWVGPSRWILIIGAGVVGGGLASFFEGGGVAGGASAGAFGLVGAWFVLGLAGRNHVDRPLRQRWVLLWMVLGAEALIRVFEPNVGSFAHMGGAVAGAAVACLYLRSVAGRFIPQAPGASTRAAALALAMVMLASTVHAYRSGQQEGVDDLVSRSIPMLGRAEIESKVTYLFAIHICAQREPLASDVAELLTPVSDSPVLESSPGLREALIACLEAWGGNLESARSAALESIRLGNEADLLAIFGRVELARLDPRTGRAGESDIGHAIVPRMELRGTRLVVEIDRGSRDAVRVIGVANSADGGLVVDAHLVAGPGYFRSVSVAGATTAHPDRLVPIHVVHVELRADWNQMASSHARAVEVDDPLPLINRATVPRSNPVGSRLR